MKSIHVKSKVFLISLWILLILPGIIIPLQTASGQRKKSKKEAPPPAKPKLVIANKGASLYRIVLPSSSSDYEKQAARVLQDYLLQISNTALPIITADKPGSPYEILLGQNDRLGERGINIDFNELEADGFVIKTDSMRLIIAGGNFKGTLYGVYTLLEKFLGCRMYSSKVKVVPTMDVIAFDPIDLKEIPVIKFRDVHYRVTYNEEFSEWHKLDHDARGGRPAWGSWVHTFNSLLPPQIYYKDHPEYFAMRDGKRLPTQLCLSNPEVLKIVIQNLRKQVASNPDAKYWSVSQNDNRQYCQCDECRAVDEREGSPSGSIIQFVNQVADQFPDLMISTLAYEYGRKAPLTISPRKNVNIMLCSIEARRDLPIDVAPDSASKSLVKDVQDWGKIASDIIVWDYVIQFTNLVSPFPNLQVLQPNIKFFADNRVTAMFEQGNGDGGGEFAELRSYLISKLLWNPNENIDTLMNDFLRGYYGAAAGPIRQYIDEMKEALLASGMPLRIFGSPNEASVSYLTPPLIIRYKQLFDQAELSVAAEPEVLERVRAARMPLNFAIMEQSKKNFTGDNGVFMKSGDTWVVRPEIRSMVDPFVDLCIRTGVTMIKEWGTTPEAYRSAMYRLFYMGRNEHLAFGKKLIVMSPDTLLLPVAMQPMLNDGIRGGHDPEYNWLSFPGKDLDVIIDLEKPTRVQHVECAFYQRAFWLSIVPKSVEFYVSNDGKKFELVSSVQNTLPIDQWDTFQRDFIADFMPREVRYVRVVAHSIGNTPGEHPGAGRPARTHIDEIVVE
ncbi:MAG TPA: DUF4838 domain-containing protein [Bacteroidales bacterium]|nr:DUF4838 domain-containing protein [Bacteroidales bacterium]